MPSLKDIRRRIQSVQQTQQITRAMRMVAAAKLRRAQDAILAARPYAERMRGTLAEVVRGDAEPQHPLLLARSEVQEVEVVTIASDRGLCGAFNGNILKTCDALIQQQEAAGRKLSVAAVGRKVLEYHRARRRDAITRSWAGSAQVGYAQAVEVAHHVCGRFLAGDVDEVWLVHSEFVSTMTQRPRRVQLLPVAPGGEAAAGDEAPYDIEPNAEALLRVLVPKAIEVEIFRGLLENQAGEHAARMAAMESATRNTEELIASLTLQYNRARQAAITKELVEIVSGAEAL
ncbi:MAG: ATP synthase F1 subunit gamma [Myxococcota bacterium]